MWGATTTETGEDPGCTGAPGTGFWTDRLLDRAGFTPLAVAVAISSALLATFLAVGWWTGDLEEVQAGEAGLWTYREFRLGLLVAMLAGYLPAARRYVARSAGRFRNALQPWLDTDEGERVEFSKLDGRAAIHASLWGLAILPISALAIDRDPTLYLRPDYWGPVVAFAWLGGLFVGWWLGSFIYVTFAYARRFSRLADQLRPIDLLDLASTEPFARHGLASALLWLVMMSLVALNLVDVAWFVVTAGIAVTVGIVALMLPVQGVHRRLQDAKRAELARIDATIRGETVGLAGSPIARRAGTLSLSDLLAWRRQVETVREWPFDTFTIVRFGLYLGIPLGSWLGGAFVERLLGAALD